MIMTIRDKIKALLAFQTLFCIKVLLTGWRIPIFPFTLNTGTAMGKSTAELRPRSRVTIRLK